VDKSSATWTLLNWLEPDPERAGKKYEEIRQSLIKLFVWRGCVDAEDLADETIDRVARRVPELVNSYEGNPERYFYGVAKKVFLEYTRQKRLPTTTLPLDTEHPEIDPIQKADEAQTREIMYDCLDKCLMSLNPQARELVLQYYGESKRAKVDFRKNLASHSGLSVSTLRARMYKIRATLEKCIEKCMKEQTSVEK